MNQRSSRSTSNCQWENLQTEEDEPVVVGVEGARLYPDSEVKSPVGEIPLGTEVRVYLIGQVGANVSVPDLGEGWVYRWELCFLSELERRKVENCVPKSVIWVSYTGTESITKRGMRAGEVPLFLNVPNFLAPGLSYWLDQSWIGHKCHFGETIITHEMNTVFMERDAQKKVVQLRILPWAAP